MVEASRVLAETNVIRLGQIVLRCIKKLPQSTQLYLYDYFKKYVDYCDGINNEDMASNGELEVIRKYILQCRVVFDVGAHRGNGPELF